MKNIYITTLFVFIVAIAFGQKSVVNTVEAITNEKVVLTLKGYVGNIQWQSSSDQNTWGDSINCTADTLQIITKSLRYYRAKITAGNCPPYYSDITLIKPINSELIAIDSLTFEDYNLLDSLPVDTLTKFSDLVFEDGSNVEEFLQQNDPDFLNTSSPNKQINSSKSFSNEEKKKLLLGRMTYRGFVITTIKPPSQKKLAYVFGAKQYETKSLPSRIEENNCKDPLYGLDCSGMIYQMALQSSLILTDKPYLCGTEFLNNIENWNTNLNKSIIYNGLKIKPLSGISLDQMEFGDIIIWPSGHVAMVTNNNMVLNSIGKKENSCEQNKNRGPLQCVLNQKFLNDFFISSYNILRITTDTILYVSTIGDDNNPGTMDSPFKTIQFAIDKAINNTTNVATIICVEQGTYSPGNGLNNSGSGVVINNSNIKLLGGWDSKFKTQIGYSILNGANSLNVIKAYNVTNITINKFEISNGTSFSGGGIDFYNVSNSKITNSKITNNTAENKGGGVCIYGGTDNLIYNSVVSGNLVTDINGGRGGGICIDNSVNNTINTTISGNTCKCEGGGLSIIGGHDNKVSESSIIENNIANGGGGISLWETNNNMIYGTINNNNSGDWGGGVHFYRSSFNTINATVTNNKGIGNANWNYMHGGGISLQDNCNNNKIYGTVSNNILTDNDGTGYYNGAGIGVWDSNYNEIYAEITNNYFSVSGSASGGGGISIAGDYNKIFGKISSNSAYEGGGIYIHVTDSHGRNNTIEAETTGNSAGFGGGVCVMMGPNYLSNIITGVYNNIATGIFNVECTQENGRWSGNNNILYLSWDLQCP